AVGLEGFEGVGAVGRFDQGGGPELLQNQRDVFTDMRLVVDEEDLASEVHREAGKVKRNSQPRLGRFSATMVPWWASTIFRQIARPNPVLFSPPVGLIDSRLKSLNSLSRSSSGIPGPWSRTAKLPVLAAGSRVTNARIVEP